MNSPKKWALKIFLKTGGILARPQHTYIMLTFCCVCCLIRNFPNGSSFETKAEKQIKSSISDIGHKKYNLILNFAKNCFEFNENICDIMSTEYTPSVARLYGFLFVFFQFVFCFSTTVANI